MAYDNDENNKLVNYKNTRTKPISNSEQLSKSNVKDVTDDNILLDNTNTNDILNNANISKEQYIKSRIDNTINSNSNYNKEPNEFNLIDYNANYPIPTNANIPNNQTLDDSLVYYIHNLTTGKQIEYNLTPETIAMNLIGYENYCIQTNNYPSWAGIAKYIGVSKNVLLDRLKSNEEYNTLYNIISNRLEELTISRTMNNYGKFGINMLENKYGEKDWNITKKSQEISIKLEQIDKKYDRNIGDIL